MEGLKQVSYDGFSWEVGVTGKTVKVPAVMSHDARVFHIPVRPMAYRLRQQVLEDLVKRDLSGALVKVIRSVHDGNYIIQDMGMSDRVLYGMVHFPNFQRGQSSRPVSFLIAWNYLGPRNSVLWYEIPEFFHAWFTEEGVHSRVFPTPWGFVFIRWSKVEHRATVVVYQQLALLRGVSVLAYRGDHTVYVGPVYGSQDIDQADCAWCSMRKSWVPMGCKVVASMCNPYINFIWDPDPFDPLVTGTGYYWFGCSRVSNKFSFRSDTESDYQIPVYVYFHSNDTGVNGQELELDRGMRESSSVDQ